MKFETALCAALLAACDNSSGLAYTPVDADTSEIPDAAVEAGPSGVGIGCSDERDLIEVTMGCRGGQVCSTSARGFPGGYCTQSCVQTPCPADAYCLSESSVRYCVRRCDDDAQCRGPEGYVCVRPSPTLPRACLPDPAPSGHRPDGSACEAPSDGGASGLAQRAFAGDEASLSHDRADSDTEAEPSLAISPLDGTVTVAYLARSAHPDYFVGLSSTRPDGGWSSDGALTDREFNSAINPSLAYGRDGELFASYLAQSLDRPQPAIRLARSADHGAHWHEPVSIAPEGRCAGGCEPPWMALGPSPTSPKAQRIQVVYLTRSTRRDAWVTAQHSDDAGAHWSAPTSLAAVSTTGAIALEPALPTITAGADGSVWVAWVMQSRANERSALGDSHNRVQVARSHDYGDRFDAPETISPDGVAVVSQSPQVAIVGARAHVVYVAGAADGRWSIALASQPDVGGAPWSTRRVNDDPPCATHGFAAIVANEARSSLELIWLDNRYGDGEVAWSRCPSDAARACEPNERVSGAGFHFSTASDPTRWHGTHATLALSPDGALWAAWSDTRTGGPAIYAARGAPSR